MTRNLIGAPHPRIEDERLVSGAGRYLDDLEFAHLCHGYMLRSQYAHANIRSIDVEAARESDGVITVLTGKDWELSGFGCLPAPGGYFRRDGSPMYLPRTPLLATNKVRWTGDCVAFIVAETISQAQDAAEKISIDYEILPALTSPEEARVRDGVLLWDDCPNNICFDVSEGDVEAVDRAFADAAIVVSEKFKFSRVTAASMEPRSCVGVFERTTGRYTLHAGIQRAHLFRNYLSRYVLNVAESKIRVVSPDVGGSFGVKGALYHELGCVLLAAKIVGRPVKWVSSRSDAFLADAHGRDSLFDASLALDENGQFLGLKVSGVAAVGAWLQPMMPAFAGNFGALAGVYRTPAISFDVTGVFTNTNPIGPYRGNGRPEASYIIERLVDMAADALDIDPAEIRRRNYISPDQMPFRTGLTFTYDCGEFEANMNKALELAEYETFGQRRANARKDGKRAGIGIANVIERAAPSGYEGAEIRFDIDGRATIFVGSVGQGQGHETAFKQIAGERLGLPTEMISYVQGDTDRVFMGEGTGGSRSTTFGGAALLLAADKVIAQGRSIAARILEAAHDQIEFAEGVYSFIGTNRSVSLSEVAALAHDPERLPPDLSIGLYATAIFRCEAPNFPNGCHVCEVEVDELTGAVAVTRYSVVDDVGTVINPLLVKGQLHGGIAQGLGQALMERIQFDESGQLLTGSFMDYAMPRATDMCRFDAVNNPVPTSTNPLGVKGAGEGGCVGALPAVANAIVDAMSDLGIRHIDMPMTSEAMWKIMHGNNCAALRREDD